MKKNTVLSQKRRRPNPSDGLDGADTNSPRDSAYKVRQRTTGSARGYLLLLGVIVLFGLLLRVVYLEKYPPAVSWDEISHGYNAYSLLKTGSDEWGKILPISNFRAYGDYPLALNLYLTIPFIAILDLSVISLKLPHVLLGTLTIIASYILFWGLTKSKKISLLASFLVAIEPWHFFFSRFAAQSNLSVFFLTASAAAFFNREKHKFLLPLSVTFLGLTLYSYHTTRIFSPLILIIIVFLYFRDIKKAMSKSVWVKRLTILSFLIFFLPLPFILASPQSRARSQEVFLINSGSVNRIIEKRLSSNYPEIITRLIYNRPVYFVVEAAKNHLGYFTPKFLFFEGGTHYQFSVPGKGLLYLANLPFFYFGFYLAIRKALGKNKAFGFIVLWFLLAPLPASITKEDFAVMRATTMLPLPQIFSAMGFFAFLSYVKRKMKNFKLKLTGIIWFLYFGILFVNMEGYLQEYFGAYTREYSWARQYGYKDVVNFIKDNYENYNKIIITKKYGEPHEFLLFYWPWDPGKYKNDPNLVRFYQSNWYWVDRFDKFYFVNDWQVDEENTGNYEFNLESGESVQCSASGLGEPLAWRVDDERCLLVTSPGNVPYGWTTLKTINFLDGKPAFEIYDNN